MDIKAPSVGESITEVRIAKWTKPEGSAVQQGEILLEIESDKATVEVVAESSGVLHITRPEGETVKIGEILGSIQEGAVAAAKTQVPAASAQASAPATNGNGASHASPALSPAVRKIVSETGVDVSQISGSGKGGRITTGDVLKHASGGVAAVKQDPISQPSQTTPSAPASNRERRVAMSMLRQKIAERLVQAQHTAAILTTFNECDMSQTMSLRAKYKEEFKAKHGVSLGFMSFFVRACVEALKAVPAVNGRIDGKEIVYHEYIDVGVAVGTEKGLVVPVLRDAQNLDFAGIEKGIAALAAKARDGKLSIQELSGGTFTISNGGVYGSLLSTPILNPPQSGILGMHKIQERPMVVDGQVVVRPMMYLALSYDHRIIDGKEAVTFLIKVKEGIENPQLLNLSI